MNAGVTVSFLGTNNLIETVTNALQKIVIIRKDRTGSKCVVIVRPAGGVATFSIKFKAQVPINGVALIPGYAMSS